MFTKVTLCGKRCPPRSKQMVDNNDVKCCLQRQENLREKGKSPFCLLPFLSGRSLFSFHCVVAPPPPPRSSEVTSPILPSQSQLIQPTGSRIFQLTFAASCDFDLFLHSKVNPENGPTIQLCRMHVHVSGVVARMLGKQIWSIWNYHHYIMMCPRVRVDSTICQCQKKPYIKADYGKDLTIAPCSCLIPCWTNLMPTLSSFSAKI